MTEVRRIHPKLAPFKCVCPLTIDGALVIDVLDASRTMGSVEAVFLCAGDHHVTAITDDFGRHWTSWIASGGSS